MRQSQWFQPDMARPVISVVIPTRDRCTILRLTLEALARQEGVDGTFEVIVVDDGSTDGTLEMLRTSDFSTFDLRSIRRALRGTTPAPLRRPNRADDAVEDAGARKPAPSRQGRPSPRLKRKSPHPQRRAASPTVTAPKTSRHRPTKPPRLLPRSGADARDARARRPRRPKHRRRKQPRPRRLRRNRLQKNPIRRIDRADAE